MSVESWVEEFFDEEALKVDLTTEEALRHSIKKYTGALPENLAKHSVGVYNMLIRSRSPNEYGSNIKSKLIFGADGCALCVKFLGYNCMGCPLYRYETCGISLIESFCYSYDRGYKVFIKTGDPTLILKEMNDELDKLRGKGE